MAARLEVEIGGINTDLKKTLRDSLSGLTEFGKSVSNLKPNGAIKINDTLRVTKTLLSDVAKMSVAASNALSGLNKNDLKTSITAQRLAFAESRAEAERYRAESVRLRNELTAQRVEQQRAADETNRGRIAAQNHRTESARLGSELASLRLRTAQNRGATDAASGSYREAQQRLTALGRAIREAEGGFRSTSPAIRAQIAEYRNLNRQLQDFDSQMGNNQRRVGNYQRAFAGIGSFIAGAFTVSAIVAAGQKILKTNAEISDSLADVRRTAGLTAKEADNLSESLKKIDTRTSLKDLLGISVIGGQLGITKTQLAGFTKAVDELAVTLSGELKGGAEGIAKSLGVLDNVFKVTQGNAGDVEKSYNQIGSAILGLGQSGLATGDFLADFGERVGGIAKQAGISLPVILSYGAVLQENGVSAEVAGTAFKRLISAISSNSAKFFAVAKFADANLTLKQFNTIVNTDTKKALDLFFAGINKGGSSTIAFNSILKSLKISGAGASQVVSALANNTVALNKHIQDATKDFNNATLSGEQFAIKNDTLAGSIDKLGKSFENVTTSGNVQNFFKSIIDGVTSSVEAIGVLSKALSAFYSLATRPKEFISETALTSRQKANKEVIDNAKKSAATQIKNQVGQKESFELVKREASILGEINKKYLEQKAIIGNLNQSDVSITQRNAFSELEDRVRFQKALVAGLKVEYDKLYRTVKRSDTAAPSLISDKKPKTKTEVINRAPEIVALSTSKEQIQGLQGVQLELAKLDQRYQKYYDDLNANATKSTEGLKTYEADIAAVRNNYDKERTQIVITEAERQSSEIDRINNIANEKLAENKDREIAEVNKRYDAEILKAQGSVSILEAIEALKLRELEKINQDFEQKRLDQQSKLVDQITDISEKQFTLNENFSNRTTQRNKEALKQRLKDIEAHFSELKKLYANNPLALTALGIAQTGANQQAIGNFNVAESGSNDKILTDLVVGFGNKFYQTLTTINQQADKSFTSIAGSLGDSVTGMLQDTFQNKLSSILKKFTEEGELSFKDLGIGLAGIAGGLISGLTKKTDSLGQATGGALTGAAAGFAVGGPIGAAVGGLVGAIGGLFGASKARKEEIELQKKQLEEAQKQTEIMRQNATAYTSSIIGRMTDQGVLTQVEVGSFGQLKATVNGKQIDFVLDRTNNSR